MWDPAAGLRLSPLTGVGAGRDARVGGHGGVARGCVESGLLWACEHGFYSEQQGRLPSICSVLGSLVVGAELAGRSCVGGFGAGEERHRGARQKKHENANCVGRESNPGQLLGRQLCSPLYHQRTVLQYFFPAPAVHRLFASCSSTGWPLFSFKPPAHTLPQAATEYLCFCMCEMLARKSQAALATD